MTTTNTEAGAVADVAAIARGLSAVDFQGLMTAQPADSYEYWLTLPVEDRRLASADWVLTPLGLAVRQHLEQGATAGVVGGKERG